MEEKKKEPRRSVVAAQIGDQGFRIERVTNFLDLKVGIVISREQAASLIAQGINFTVCRNK